MITRIGVLNIEEEEHFSGHLFAEIEVVGEVCLTVISCPYTSEYTRVGAVHGHPHEAGSRV